MLRCVRAFVPGERLLERRRKKVERGIHIPDWGASEEIGDMELK